MDKIDTIYFRWDHGNRSLLVRKKSLSESLAIAKSMGFHKSVWYKPSTWGNNYTIMVLR